MTGAGEPSDSDASIAEPTIDIINVVLELNTKTLETVPLLISGLEVGTGTADFYFTDAEDEKVFQFNIDQQELFIKRVEGRELIGEYSVNGFALYQGPSDADYMAQDDDFGKLIISTTGLTSSGGLGGLVYGDIVAFTQGSQYRTITACNTQAMMLLPMVSQTIAKYPKTCINGAPYDITVDTRANIAYVSALNIILPESAVLLSGNTFSEPPLIYRNIHAVSLQTGEVSTVFSSY